MEDQYQFLTVDEVMEMLRMSRATVYRLVKNGKLRAYSFGGGRLRFKRSDIDSMIAESMVGPTPTPEE